MDFSFITISNLLYNYLPFNVLQYTPYRGQHFGHPRAQQAKVLPDRN